jgi:hypothetical protein
MAKRRLLAGLWLALSLATVACGRHEAARELAVSDVETYWIVDSPREGQNYIAPVVRFRLKNVGNEPLGSVQARAKFPAADQEEAWGSIQEQVSTWRRPLAPGQDRIVTVRSAGRYHSAADPEDILRSPAFKDPRVEVFVRIGASDWAMLAQASVERRIGAPELQGMLDAPTGGR